MSLGNNETGVLQTPTLCLQMPIQGESQQRQVHPSFNIYLQLAHLLLLIAHHSCLSFFHLDFST